MQLSPVIPAIWCRFTPYLIVWAENEFGTGLELCGRRVLELRPLQGVRQALREAVEEDDVLSSSNKNSLSQMRYEVVLSVLDARTYDANVLASYSKDNIKSYLPVHTPGFLLVEGGVIHQFSRLMQFQPKIAQYLSRQVYLAFWTAVWRFSRKAPSLVDRDMLESFCEEEHIPSIYVDDLRNQYQRMKRKGFFTNKS